MGHSHCRHQFKFCAQCDMVWCGSCSKEWGGHAHTFQQWYKPTVWSGADDFNSITSSGTSTLMANSHASHGTNEVEMPGAERHAHGEPVLPDGTTK